MSSGNGFGAASAWLIQKGLAAWSRLTKDDSPPATTDTEGESSSTYKELKISEEKRNVQPSTSRASYSSRPDWPRGPPERTYQPRSYHGRTFIRLNKPSQSQGSLDKCRPKQRFDYRSSTSGPDKKPSASPRQAASGEHVFPSTSTYRASSSDARSSLRDLRYPSSSAPKSCFSPRPTEGTTRADPQGLVTSSIGKIQPDLYKKKDPLFLPSKASGAILGRLHAALKYDFDRSDFIVHLIEVHDLPRIERGGFNQPYIRLQLLPPVDDRKRQTDAYMGRGDPCFEETFKFPAALEDLQCRTLILQILDNDRFSKSDVMGEVKILIADIELSSAVLEIWAEVSRAKKPQDELRKILISMIYLPSAERLSVTIVRLVDLSLPEEESNLEAFAKIYLSVDGKTIKKRKTQKKRNWNGSLWNEAVGFDLSCEKLSKAFIKVKAFRRNPEFFGRPILLGACEIGPEEENLDLHWEAVINTPRKTITMWHVLH